MLGFYEGIDTRHMMKGMIMAGVDMGYMMMKEKIWITRLVLWNVVIVGIAITEANAWLIVFFFH
jgi:hypothetical protein